MKNRLSSRLRLTLSGVTKSRGWRRSGVFSEMAAVTSSGVGVRS